METLKIPAALHETRLLHEKYQMGLTFWNQFVIWSYTLGSGVVNNSLLGTINKKNLSVWCGRIANTYREVTTKKNRRFPQAYKEFVSFLIGSGELDFEAQKRFLALYIENLQYLIKSAPALTGAITVFKASSPYPGLKVGKVEQKPFNSTSYRVDMNYSIFLPPDGLCCMHRITIPKGSRVLILSPLLSAYPDEAEILLPHGVAFNVSNIYLMPLEVPVQTPQLEFKQIQSEPYTLGPVYFYNYKVDCLAETRNVRLYNSVLSGT
jgi:hypothetical protein